jgi:predicted nuclease of predicted toxin-antitoxin system
VRILLDECVPARLKKAFPGHAVQSVTQTDWRTSKDGPLLSFAQDRFDIFVTVDRRLEKQNDLSKFKLGFIIARVPNNRLDGFEPIFEQLNAVAEKVRQGEVIYIVSPELKS